MDDVDPTSGRNHEKLGQRPDDLGQDPNPIYSCYHFDEGESITKMRLRDTCGTCNMAAYKHGAALFLTFPVWRVGVGPPVPSAKPTRLKTNRHGFRFGRRSCLDGWTIFSDLKLISLTVSYFIGKSWIQNWPILGIDPYLFQWIFVESSYIPKDFGEWFRMKEMFFFLIFSVQIIIG